MAKPKKDQYAVIDEALQSYEDFKPYHTKSIDWICDRIDWCWKFRYITREQMESLADRATNIIKMQIG